MPIQDTEMNISAPTMMHLPLPMSAVRRKLCSHRLVADLETPVSAMLKLSRNARYSFCWSPWKVARCVGAIPSSACIQTDLESGRRKRHRINRKALQIAGWPVLMMRQLRR